jgi:hypothetical protein
MYGQYSWFNSVHLSKRQLESEFVSLPQQQNSFGQSQQTGEVQFGFEASSYFEK